MELRNVFKVGAFGLLLAAAGGCYEYPPPPAATMGDTYTQRKQDGADRLLDDITDLTLADLAPLAPLLGCEPLDIQGAHVPFDGAYADETIGGMMVLTPDISSNRSQLKRFLESE